MARWAERGPMTLLDEEKARVNVLGERAQPTRSIAERIVARIDFCFSVSLLRANRTPPPVTA
jgi:hypothetical protein